MHAHGLEHGFNADLTRLEIVMSIEPDNGPVSLGEHEHLRTLPDAQRYRIAMELLLSLGLRAEAEYVQERVLQQELMRYCDRLDDGKETSIPGDAFLTELRQKYQI